MALSVTNLGIDGLEDVEQIGTGGSSRVYRARQVDLDRVVAVKVLNPGGDSGVARRFDRERKAMGRLSLHEGIVPVYSSGVTTHGEPYLVMPYYPNGSLQDQIDAGPLEWETAVSYVDVAAETIGAAHDEGIVHLDLKPANILLTNTGAPRIADFGIARLTGVATAGTTAGTAFTPAYSAPETFLDGETGPPSDVYGLGATLWALLVGHPPFLTPGDDSNLMAVIGRVVNNQVGDLRHIAPPAICDVIERAMTKRPEDRYQTASEFSLALKQAAAGVSANFAPPTIVDPGTALFPSVPDAVPSAAAGAAAAASVAAAGSNDTTVHQLDPTATSPAPASRTLLQETAQPLPKPVDGPPPITPAPFIDMDRYRMAPILLALVAFLAVVGIGAWALFRDGGTTSAEDGEPTEIPVGPTTEVTSSSTATTGAAGPSSSSEVSTSLTTEGTASSTTPTTTGSSTSSSETTTPSSSSSSSTTEDTTTTTEATTSTTEDTTTTIEATTSTTSTTTTVVVEDPEPPATVTATAGDDDTSVTLTWTAPSSGPDPEGYRLFRNGTVLRQRLPAARTTFTDNNLDPGTYTYTVRTIGPDDELSSGTSATVTIGPLAINTFNVERNDPERVVASFSTNKCVTGYTISAVPTGGGDTVSETGPASGCVDSDTVILGGLDAATGYQVNLRVRLGDELVTDFRMAPAPSPGP